MALAEELERVAALAAAHAADDEKLAGIVAAEPAHGRRVYVCAYEGDHSGRTWLVLDQSGEPLEQRAEVRDAASIAALCEVAVEVAGGGDLEELRAQLVALRLCENPPGIAEAEEAALALERAVGAPPRVASPAYLDAVGGAARRLEQALGQAAGSPFAAAMQAAIGSVEELAAEIEGAYKRPFR